MNRKVFWGKSLLEYEAFEDDDCICMPHATFVKSDWCYKLLKILKI